MRILVVKYSSHEIYTHFNSFARKEHSFTPIVDSPLCNLCLNHELIVDVHEQFTQIYQREKNTNKYVFRTIRIEYQLYFINIPGAVVKDEIEQLLRTIFFKIFGEVEGGEVTCSNLKKNKELKQITDSLCPFLDVH